jgi:hypothetical protein
MEGMDESDLTFYSSQPFKQKTGFQHDYVIPIEQNATPNEHQRDKGSTEQQTRHSKRKVSYAERIRFAKKIGEKTSGQSSSIQFSDASEADAKVMSRPSSDNSLEFQGTEPDLDHRSGFHISSRSRRFKHSERKERLKRVLVKLKTVGTIQSSPNTRIDKIDAIDKPISEEEEEGQIPSVLLQPSMDSTKDLHTSFVVIDGHIIAHSDRDDLDRKPSPQEVTEGGGEHSIGSSQHFPATVANLSEVAGMPGALLSRPSNARSSDGTSMVNKISTNIFPDSWYNAVSESPEGSITSPNVLKLKKVATDVLLDPESFLQESNLVLLDTESASSSFNTNTVEERKPEEDATTAATPFFGAALRHMKAMSEAAEKKEKKKDNLDEIESSSDINGRADSDHPSMHEAFDLIEEMNPVEMKLMTERPNNLKSANHSHESFLLTPLRRDDQAIGSKRVSVESDFKFSSGQQELSGVELDNTLPPQTTRRSKDWRRRSSEVTESIKSSLIVLETNHDLSEELNVSYPDHKSISNKGRSSVNEISDVSFDHTKTKTQYCEEMHLRSVESGRYSSRRNEAYITSKEPVRVSSFYRSRRDMEPQNQFDESMGFFAGLSRSPVVLEDTGERPVLKRFYVYSFLFACFSLVFLLPLVFLRGAGADSEENQCQVLGSSKSLKRCACNGTAEYMQDKSFIARYELIRNILASSGIVLNDNVNEGIEDCSNKNIATHWLAEDPWELVSDEILTIQRYIIGLFFLEMNGFEWIEATGWMSQIDICEWIGLTCSASKLVISMKMDNNNLRGNLPLELSFLKILSSLHLVENFIEGTFPSFLNDLPQLQEIDLSGNLIDDAFPGGIVKLNATLGKQK